jgi:LacI family transcriptional regulator
VRNGENIREIAKRAGVSAAVASAVLSGKEKSGKGARFSEETARRVRSAAKTAGYVPNRLAKAIIGKETFAIGVLSAFERHERYDAIIRALSGRCQEKGYHLIVTPCGFSHEEQMVKLRSLVSLQVSEVVMIPAASENTEPAKIIAEFKEKLALCPNLIGVDWFRDELIFDNAEPDERLMIELPLEHLKERGHHVVSVIGGRSARRDKIIREALSKLEMKETGREPGRSGLPAHLAESDVSEMTRAVLSAPRRPTALCCLRDSFASAAYRVCEREFGLKVGKDIALIGNDNTLVASSMPVPLSSMDMRDNDLSDTVFRLIVERIAGKDKTGPRNFTVSPRLIIRESSDFNITGGRE